MNTKTLFIAAALLAAVAGTASAEGQADDILQNRTPFHGELSRAQVQAQLAAARRSGDLSAIGEASSFGQPSPAVGQLDRAEVRAGAVALAHAPNQNMDPRAFFGSRLPDSLAATDPMRQASVPQQGAF